VVLARSVETLGEAALVQESLLQACDLVVQEIVRLVDQTENRVGGGLGRGLLDIGPIGQIGPIGPIRDPADRLGRRCILGPDGQVTLAEEILVVLQQFFQARAGDARELELGLLAGRGGLAALRGVLLAAPGGLYHLIVRPRAAVDKAIAKGDRRIVDDLGRLVGLEISIAAMGRDQWAFMSPLGPIRPIGPILFFSRSRRSSFLHGGHSSHGQPRNQEPIAVAKIVSAAFSSSLAATMSPRQ
jgi:hypothetical protein